MTTTTPLALALLRPWLDTLHTLTVRPVAVHAASSASSVASATSPRMRLVWHLPTGPSRSDMTKYLEAIELLVLLAWADANAWIEAAAVLGDSLNDLTKHQWTTVVLEAPRPVTVIGHDVKCGTTDDIRALCDYLISPERTNDTLSPEYYAVRATIEATRGLPESVEIPVGLHLDRTSPWQAQPVIALPSIAALAATQHKLRDDNDASDCRLTRLCSRVDKFHDDLFAITTGDEEYLGRLAEIWSHGIRVFDLPHLELPERPHNGSLYVEALHMLLGIRREGCVERVLVDRRGPANSVSTLFSALAHSTSVRDVMCGFGGTEEEEGGFQLQRREEILYLAYALFRADITNNIDTISLWSQNLTMEDVGAMRQVLDADDPLIGLFPDLATSIQAHHDLSVTASCLLLDDPTTNSNETVTTRSDLIFKNLRVLDYIDGYWIVFLPGWGQAWIRGGHGVVTRATREIPVASKIRSIAELTLYDFPSGNEAVVVNLLQLVGANVKALGLGDHDRDRMRDASLTKVFRACANLERLELIESAPHRLSIIAESFANGYCPRLKFLKLCIQFVTVPMLHEIALILDVLADRRHPMTKLLEQLEILTSSMMGGPEPAESAVLDVAVHMLESNKHLPYLKLRLPIAVRDVATIERLKHAFAAHHDVLIPVRVGPLSGRHKAAFLSVVWSQATMSTASATQQFDARIVSRIWAFAPERRRRLLDVTMPQLFEVAEED